MSFRDIVLVLWVVLVGLQAVMVQLPSRWPALDLSPGYVFFLALGLGKGLLTLIRSISSPQGRGKNKEEHAREG
jgi:hypothetical protein